MPGIETNTGQQTAEQLHATAEQVRDQVRENVEERVGERTSTVSRQMLGLARALRSTADQCERQPDGRPIAGYARHAADGVEQIGDVLDGKSLSEILVDLERLSRERPILVGAAAVAAGLLGVRVTRTAMSVHRADAEAEADAERARREAQAQAQEPPLIIQSEGGL
jgi:hypothetical protein